MTIMGGRVKVDLELEEHGRGGVLKQQFFILFVIVTFCLLCINKLNVYTCGYYTSTLLRVLLG